MSVTLAKEFDEYPVTANLAVWELSLSLYVDVLAVEDDPNAAMNITKGIERNDPETLWFYLQAQTVSATGGPSASFTHGRF